MRLSAASLCHTNKPAANSTRKMQLRYLQHVFRWTTNAGSLECSSFVLRKPAAPSRSMAVCGIILSSRAGRSARFLVEAGLWVTAGPRPLWCAPRRSCWRSWMRNTCASANERCPAVRSKRHAETASSLSVFFAWDPRRRPPALSGGSEAVERRPVDRFDEDESGAVPTTNRVSPRTALDFDGAKAAADAFLDRSPRNLKASISRHRTAEAQVTPRRDHRALCQRL